MGDGRNGRHEETNNAANVHAGSSSRVWRRRRRRRSTEEGIEGERDIILNEIDTDWRSWREGVYIHTEAADPGQIGRDAKGGDDFHFARHRDNGSMTSDRYFPGRVRGILQHNSRAR
jgi:hypothetical protein